MTQREIGSSVHPAHCATHDGHLVLLADMLPESAHVEACRLAEADDRAIWSFARGAAYVIVSKDSDFSDLSLLVSPDWAVGRSGGVLRCALGPPNCALWRVDRLFVVGSVPK